jgi:hypothetical protein
MALKMASPIKLRGSNVWQLKPRDPADLRDKVNLEQSRFLSGKSLPQ